MNSALWIDELYCPRTNSGACSFDTAEDFGLSSPVLVWSELWILQPPQGASRSGLMSVCLKTVVSVRLRPSRLCAANFNIRSPFQDASCRFRIRPSVALQLHCLIRCQPSDSNTHGRCHHGTSVLPCRLLPVRKGFNPAPLSNLRDHPHMTFPLAPIHLALIVGSLAGCQPLNWLLELHLAGFPDTDSSSYGLPFLFACCFTGFCPCCQRILRKSDFQTFRGWGLHPNDLWWHQLGLFIGHANPLHKDQLPAASLTRRCTSSLQDQGFPCEPFPSSFREGLLQGTLHIVGVIKPNSVSNTGFRYARPGSRHWHCVLPSTEHTSMRGRTFCLPVRLAERDCSDVLVWRKACSARSCATGQIQRSPTQIHPSNQ